MSALNRGAISNSRAVPSPAIPGFAALSARTAAANAMIESLIGMRAS